MDLVKLFEIQKVLDEHIMTEHPVLRGQDNLDWKILALQVELGECANEWRGFKKWSKDQQPRTFKSRRPYMDLEDAEFYNPMLEEYVDCLHFILSIGLEIGIEESFSNLLPLVDERLDNVTIMFHQLFACSSNLFWDEYYDSHSHYDYIELFQCFLKLGEMLGFTWEQIEQAYLEKNKINHQRQEVGY